MLTKVVAVMFVICSRAMGRHHHYGYYHGYEDVHHPQPYDYGYSVNDGYGNQQYKKEAGDGKGVVKGTYGYTDAYGIHRQVNYISDHRGYRAQVKTNEPGTASQNPAAVGVHSAPPKHIPHFVPSYAPSYVIPFLYGPQHPHY